jgi:hypothetical protein
MVTKKTIRPNMLPKCLRMNTVFVLFNLSFPFSILQSTYKYKSECEENVFLGVTYIVNIYC